MTTRAIEASNSVKSVAKAIEGVLRTTHQVADNRDGTLCIGGDVDPVEIAIAAIAAICAELDRAGYVIVSREAANEAADGWEEAAQYKGSYLAEKHGDAEGVAAFRAMFAAFPG